MAQTVNILPHAEDRKQLLAIVADYEFRFNPAGDSDLKPAT